MTRTGQVVAWSVGLFWLSLHALAVRGEENVRPEVPSIFSADSQTIPSSIEEMLPAPARAGETATHGGQLRSVALAGQMTAEMDDARFEGIYRRLNNRNDIFPAQRRSEDRFSRALDAVFTPEPIRIGGTEVSFSPITAIKRKNPLCLLNPLIFNVSW
jgi:hypothetical protein